MDYNFVLCYIFAVFLVFKNICKERKKMNVVNIINHLLLHIFYIIVQKLQNPAQF
jgi:uncharacterized membrane protein YczE